MKKTTLIISLTAFAVGILGVGPGFYSFLGLPVGTAFLALYLISTFLEKEMALYDEQNQVADPDRLCSAGTQRSAASHPAANPVFTAAHSS